MQEKNKILIIDDEKINRIALHEFLQDEYEIIEANNGMRGFKLLEEYANEIAAVVLDLIMPVMDGYLFLEGYQKCRRYRMIPVIVATASSEETAEKRCLELGAWDFVLKPYNQTILRFRLRNAIERSAMIHDERDDITGLNGKKRFFRDTRELLDTYPDDEFTFLRMDIDHFKMINTFYGMAEGDRLLGYLAEIVRQVANEIAECTYGRIEGDVFCLCYRTELYDQTQLCEQLLRRIGEYRADYYIDPSIGTYQCRDSSEDISTLYDKATLAAMECKGIYQKHFVSYTDRMSAQLIREQRIVNEMDEALQAGQFQVYFQPKYDVATERPCGAEALVRWIHPTKGRIAPVEFIPIFERNGFIGKLDYYVWESTCSYIRKWMDAGYGEFPISVNVSRADLYNSNLVEEVIALTKKYDIKPQLLNLELTESVFAEDTELVKKTMTQFQKAGFIILMDDFGSGYSSLNLLKDIDLDILKVDMRFLSEGGEQGKGRKILASIEKMAKWINIPVIMEGVETKEQVDFLKGIGCEYIQGYYYAKPMPVEAFEHLVFKQADDNK